MNKYWKKSGSDCWGVNTKSYIDLSNIIEIIAS